MENSFIESCSKLVNELPLPIMSLRSVPERKGALLYSGEIPDDASSVFNEWVEKALWMLENSAVLARNLPTGKFVALAYKNGYVVISNDLNDMLSEEMRTACQVASYEDFGLNRESTCLVLTQTPFELSICVDGSNCTVFLIGNPKADIVVYSKARLNQIVV
jgi:hypothetical protein